MEIPIAVQTNVSNKFKTNFISGYNLSLELISMQIDD